MNPHQARTHISEDHQPGGAEPTRFHGRQLIIARSVWVTLVVLTLSVFLVLFRGYVALEAGQLPQDPRFSGGFFTATILLTIVSMLLCSAVASVIFWRRSNDWMALLVALMLVMIGTAYVTDSLQKSLAPERAPALILSNVTFVVFFLVFCLFPDGRFVPRWIGWLPIVWLTWSTFFTVLYLFYGAPFAIHELVWLGALLLLVAVQMYRYRYVSSPMQRQQTKWVVFGISIAILEVLAISLPLQVFPLLVRSGFGYHLLSVVGYTFALLLGSLSFAVAILRSRLYNIDLLINRTLVYGILTAILTLVYLGLILALQSLLRGMINQNNDVALVISTLAIAALFQPLRRRIQQVIDRRFYRRKYDATKTLEAFSATLRSEVELSTLCEELVAVVQETMQPTRVSLWLIPPEPRAKHQVVYNSDPQE
jgi:hypothetical protein